MSHRESWLALLAPLPAEGGEWKQETRTDSALAGWTQVRLVLGDGVTGLRVLTAMFDPEGHPGSVSDLVSKLFECFVLLMGLELTRLLSPFDFRLST
jgi:hypothetical protein